jgi:hypothetical protein
VGRALKRAASAAVVVGIAAVGVTALVDSIRPQEDEVSARGEPTPEAALAHAGVTGTLVLTDAACRTHVVRLPSLEVENAASKSCGDAKRARGALPRDVVSAALSGRLAQPRSYRVAELARTADGRVAAILRGRRPWQQAVAVFRGRRVTLVVPHLGSQLSGMRISPSGLVAVLRSDISRVAEVLDASGREVELPQIANVHAVAWSPDEHWTALSTRTGTFIARTGTQQVVARVPVGAESVSWN